MVAMARIFGGLLLALTAACTPIERSGAQGVSRTVESPAPPTATPRPGVVVTVLQTRDHEITVYSTDRGPRFTVAAAGGVVLAQQLTVDEFRNSFPGLHRRYDTAFAGETLGLDASIDYPRMFEARNR